MSGGRNRVLSLVLCGRFCLMSLILHVGGRL